MIPRFRMNPELPLGYFANSNLSWYNLCWCTIFLCFAFAGLEPCSWSSMKWTTAFAGSTLHSQRDGTPTHAMAKRVLHLQRRVIIDLVQLNVAFMALGSALIEVS